MNDSAALRQLKTDLGLTWQQMANMLGVHLHTVRNMAYEHKPFTNGMRQRLRKTFGADFPDKPRQRSVAQNEDRIQVGCLVLRIGVPRLTKMEAELTARILDREGWPWIRRCAA